MVDACIIRRVTAVPTGSHGQTTDTTTVIYSGKCRFQQPGGYGRNAVPTPVDPALMHYRILQLPVSGGTAGIRQADQVTATVATNDPSLLGVEMVVRDQDDGKTDATTRRVGVDQVTG